MKTENQTFKCDEIRIYDEKINEESYSKINKWVEQYSKIKIGDIVEWNNKKLIIIDIELLGCEGKYSFDYIVKPVNKKNKAIENRKHYRLHSVIKDGVIYENPSYLRQLYTPAQLRFNDYYYKHRRNQVY